MVGGKIGKNITTLGVFMFFISIILVFIGISGALIHNILQVGGLIVAVIGLVIWKGLKK